MSTLTKEEGLAKLRPKYRQVIDDLFSEIIEVEENHGIKVSGWITNRAEFNAQDPRSPYKIIWLRGSDNTDQIYATVKFQEGVEI